jgi:hypothetical protein
VSNNRFGSHWQGPILGSERSNTGGIWEDLPIEAGIYRNFRRFYDDGAQNLMATHWILTQIGAGGTASYQVNTGLQISHGVNDQGPAVQLGSGTVYLDTAAYRRNTFLAAEPNRRTVCAIEARLTKSAGTAGAASVYWGFGTAIGGGPLAPGTPDTINVAGMANGAGWALFGASTFNPVLWDAGVQRTLAFTGSGTTTNFVNTGLVGARVYGVRIESNWGSAAGPTRDYVTWYVDGKRVGGASPGATGAGTFSGNMTAYWAMLSTGSASTWEQRNFAFAAYDLHTNANTD